MSEIDSTVVGVIAGIRVIRVPDGDKGNCRTCTLNKIRDGMACITIPEELEVFGTECAEGRYHYEAAPQPE